MVVCKLVKTLYCQKEPNNKMMKCFAYTDTHGKMTPTINHPGVGILSKSVKKVKQFIPNSSQLI